MYPKELSGGMKQGVAIARACSAHPEVLLLNEPFSALDAQTRIKLQSGLLDAWGVRGHKVAEECQGTSA